MRNPLPSFISEEEYLAQERVSDMKNEYFQGEIFAMAGASERHNLIVSNIIGELHFQLKKTPCRVYPSDMRLKVQATGLFSYPDVMIVCGDIEFSDDKQDTLKNPDVIIEVLSKSTEGYDRGTKFEHFRRLPSLKEYVLISQNRKKIEKFSRITSPNWVLTETGKNLDRIELDAVQCWLELDEIYDKVLEPEKEN